jgi:hypothetical protein
LDSGGRMLSCNRESRRVIVCNADFENNGIINGFVVGDKVVSVFVLATNGNVFVFVGGSPEGLSLV